MLSFCTAYRIYNLEHKEPEYVIKEIPKYVEVSKPCPSPPPTPICTPPPQPPFNVSVAQKKWSDYGRFLVSYEVNIPADGEWHDSRIQVSPGVNMMWNYDDGYSGGLSVRIGALQYTQHLPLDYKSSFYRHKFMRRKEYGDYEKDDVILDSAKTVEFKALETDLVIRVELWEQ
jgi:hypothetical protein